MSADESLSNAENLLARLESVGHSGDTVNAALESWAGVENLEERMVPGLIDPVVLAHLRATTA